MYTDFLRKIIQKEKTKNYNEKTFDILSFYKDNFLSKDFVFYIDNDFFINNEKLAKYMIMYSPFMHSFKRQTDNRNHLFELINLENIKENELYCIGCGSIDENGIFVVGMAPGFYNGNKWDEISKPFKPSFYFAETSHMIRLGFMCCVKDIYFTNLSKTVCSKDKMDKIKYEQLYEKDYEILKKEINILKPKTIISMGNDVYEFLKLKGINTIKSYHPSYFFYNNKFNDGIEYYRKICKNLKQN